MKKENGFAQRLQSLRKEKQLSQTDLGKLVHLHFTHISRYERGLSKPAAETLMRLADVLGVTTDYLMEGAADSAVRAKLNDRDLLRQFQEIEKLSDPEKSVVKIFLDAFLTKKKIQSLAA